MTELMTPATHRLRRAGASAVREERVFPSTLEVRAAGDGEPTRIVGHASVYNRWSEDLGGFKERVLPGAFTKTLADKADVRCLFNHDANYIMGRTKPGTLEVRDEPKGLYYEATPPDTQTIRDLVLTPIDRGDIDQCSFSFATVRDEWREPAKTGGLWERDLLEVRLYDVSPVTFPAYIQTDVSLRALISSAGVDFALLNAVIIRAERGLPLLQDDIDLVNGSIEALRSYLPPAPAPAEGDHPDEPDAARHTVAHLRRLLEHAEATA